MLKGYSLTWMVCNEVEQFHGVSIHHENGKLSYVLFDDTDTDTDTHFVVHHKFEDIGIVDREAQYWSVLIKHQRLGSGVCEHHIHINVLRDG